MAPRKSNLAKAKCALCEAKDVSEPRGEERYCRDCWEKKIAVEEIVAREFALKRYIRAHSAEKYLIYHSTIKRPCGQILVVDDGYDLFLSVILYPNFGWDEPAYHLDGAADQLAPLRGGEHGVFGGFHRGDGDCVRIGGDEVDFLLQRVVVDPSTIVKRSQEGSDDPADRRQRLHRALDGCRKVGL